MGRYKFNNRSTGTIFWLGFFIQWRIQGGGGGVTGMITPPPLELVPILKTYCKVFGTGTDDRVLVNVQEWRCVSIFRRADDVTRTMSKGVVLVNVQEWGCFSIFQRADDVTQTMSKGGGCLWNVFTPLQEILYPRLLYLCKISGKSTPLPPLTKAFPYAYV